MKKRIFAIIVGAALACMACVALAGCGSAKYADNSYADTTWNGTTAIIMGTEFDVNDLWDGGFSVTLEADGDCTVSVAGNNASVKWEPTDNGFWVDKDGTLNYEFVGVDDNTITTNIEGADITFVKQ